MITALKDFYETVSLFDLIYLIITILSLIKCSRKGFVLSVLAASKWLLAYVITLILFPKTKPYVDGIIDSEYVLDITLGIGIFALVIFIILMINKGISRAVKYSGLGTVDTVFGFFFGFLRSYIICICIFSTITIVYNYNKWPINLNESLTFPYVKKGSNYLIKEFPDEKNYEETKEKIEEL
jgi:membrane protein required for colicin V production|tara:strand:+ start:475 stop:1020 length:546 start_codon:yes stop_codon:yes gene_type:complete